MRRIWFALSVGTSALILGAMSPKAVADESSAGTAANGNVNADVDVKEEQHIRTVLQNTPDLKNNQIQVSVDDGIAVLEGSVDSEREKKEAQQLAHVDGILGVNNRLQVRSNGK